MQRRFTLKAFVNVGEATANYERSNAENLPRFG
jgi:hypothetical protein